MKSVRGWSRGHSTLSVPNPNLVQTRRLPRSHGYGNVRLSIMNQPH